MATPAATGMQETEELPTVTMTSTALGNYPSWCSVQFNVDWSLSMVIVHMALFIQLKLNILQVHKA